MELERVNESNASYNHNNSFTENDTPSNYLNKYKRKIKCPKELKVRKRMKMDDLRKDQRNKNYSIISMYLSYINQFSRTIGKYFLT